MIRSHTPHRSYGSDAFPWQLSALCRTADPTLFFHPDGERGRAQQHRQLAAKQTCASCTVIAACRQAERVSELLRRDVLEGKLGTDDRIKDQELMARFGVSRSTAREALRMVASEGLVVLCLHAGAVVRRLDDEDVRDIYRVRKSVEYSALTGSSRAPTSLFAAIRDALATAEECVTRKKWPEALTASLDLHAAIVDLQQSPRLSKFVSQQLAQLRVAFWALPMESDVQALWVSRDRAIVDLLLRGQRDMAGTELLQYLDDAEAAVLDAYRAIELAQSPTFADTSRSR